MVKRITRCLCILLLLPCTALHVCAAVQVDGYISPREEYGMKAMVLIAPGNESNSNVSHALLCWHASEAERSVYIGVRYVCDDLDVLLRQMREGETDAPQTQTGVEVSINGVRCFTALLDGTVTDLDRDRFDADVCVVFYDDSDTDNPETNNFDAECRLGLKYWMPHDSVLGLRILDCGGVPSNYYEIPIYPAPPTTAAAETTGEKTGEKPAKTTTEKATTTRADLSAQSSAVETTQTTRPRTSTRVIAAASAASQTAKPSTRAASTQGKTAAEQIVQVHLTASAQETQTEPNTTAPAGTKAPTESETATETTQGSETDAPADVSAAENVSILHNAKLLGITAAAVLLTAALMTSVFLGLPKRKQSMNASPEPQEQETFDEFDDF